jgi:hypothetical protein
MTQKEKIAFAQGVEEGFVHAAELSAEPEKILRQFRPISSTFRTKMHPSTRRKHDRRN